MRQENTQSPLPELRIRPAEVDDAADIWQLVRDTGVLDLNSPYSYLLLCRRFGDTCLVAELDDELVGFVTALRPPKAPEVIFVWQIGIAAKARGRGLARRLLEQLIQVPACHDVEWLEATVSPDNEASSALFHSFARHVGAACRVSPYFERDDFPTGEHEPEKLHRIGPLPLHPSVELGQGVSADPASSQPIH